MLGFLNDFQVFNLLMYLYERLDMAHVRVDKGAVKKVCKPFWATSNHVDADELTLKIDLSRPMFK